MNVFSVWAFDSPLMTKVAQELSDNDVILAFDDDEDGVTGIVAGDLFHNRENDVLYKVAQVVHNEEEAQIIVQAARDFPMKTDEFNALMDKIAGINDVERRHWIGDAILVHMLKQAAPECQHGVGVFEQLGKWYA